MVGRWHKPIASMAFVLAALSAAPAMAQNKTLTISWWGFNGDKLEEIIDFAEIGDYIDQPVRTYSSGMFLRLAFGVATAASPDLLLVDEVLAVTKRARVSKMGFVGNEAYSKF